MNGYVYYVVSCHYDMESLAGNGRTKGNIAYVEKIGRSQNLLTTFQRIGGLKSINTCKTKKEAEQIANDWNEACRNNGTYAFA